MADLESSSARTQDKLVFEVAANWFVA